MSNDKLRVIHYLNQFFGQEGREEKADIKLMVKEGPVGPGVALQKALGEEAEVVATIVGGDNYVAANAEEAAAEAIKLLKPYKPDLFFAGPAFEAGRYGISCGALCKAVGQELGIPVITGMYEENPGVELYRTSSYIVKTGNTAVRMAQDLERMVAIGRKLLAKTNGSRLLSGETIGRPSEDGYFPRGVVRNEYTEKTAAERGVDMLLAKLGGRDFVNELPLPKFEKVPPPLPVTNLAASEIALVSDAGLCPKGNPHGLSGRGNKVWCTYEIDSLFEKDSAKVDLEVVHTGYFPVEVLENPFRMVPVDVLRDMEQEGTIGKLHPTYFCTSGNATVAKTCQKMGEEIATELSNRGIQAVILTST